ncbi:MAG: hypothetical protein IKV55_03810, partial [Oscillospiraceae bacterium]|nr:hypothetical protein [Oscillospiraceae bacterium]
MKKLMCILLMLALCAALTACGSSDDPYGILSGDYQPAGGGEQTDGSSSSSSSAAEPEDSEISVEVPAEGPQSGAYGYFVELADPYFGEGVYARIECNGFGENEFGEHYLVFTAYCKDDGSDPAPIFVEDLEGSALINGMPVTLRLGIEEYLMPGEFAGTSVVL